MQWGSSTAFQQLTNLTLKASNISGDAKHTMLLGLSTPVLDVTDVVWHTVLLSFVLAHNHSLIQSIVPCLSFKALLVDVFDLTASSNAAVQSCLWGPIQLLLACCCWGNYSLRSNPDQHDYSKCWLEVQVSQVRCTFHLLHGPLLVTAVPLVLEMIVALVT